MKKSIKKITMALLVTFLLSSTVLVMLGHAQTSIPTTASLYIAPNPVGVGQSVSLLGRIQPDPPAGEYFYGLTLDIWRPDSVEFPETIGSFYTDSEGFVNLPAYTPDIVGTYSFTLHFPENAFESGETYLASQSATFYLTVQQEVVPVGPIVRPGGSVTPGDHVTVFPDPEDSRVSLYFEHITGSGTATVSKTAAPPSGVPPLPGILGLYYDFDATFTFTGPVVVGLPYDAGLTNEDLRMWHYEGGVVGDVNRDGKVDWRDLLLIAFALGSRPGMRRWNLACDLNGDKRVDFSDLFIALRNYGGNTRTWVDVTSYVDTVNNIVYGSTPNFPPFGIRYR